VRIAYICETGGVWGGVRIIAEHLNRLVDRGYECWFYALQPSLIDWLPTRFYQSTLESASPLVGKCDVVVATAGSTWQLVANDPRFGRAKRMCLVQMMEHLFYPPESEAYKAFVNNVKLPLYPIVISEWLKKEMEKFNPRPVSMIRNGIDPNLFFPDPWIDKHPKLRLLVEGNSLNQAKDVDEMVHWAILALKRSGYEFETWGFSQNAPRWEFDRYWVLPRQEDIRHIYSSCDILVKATRYEGRPGPDLEAMACGCAVNRAILTGDDDLKNGYNCLVVKYGDQVNFTDNLQRLVVDEELRRTLIANGKIYVRDHANWDGAIDLLEKAMFGEPEKPKESKP
jgi:glycosyltransferase involved in cell wall biosynthesis